MSRHCHLSLDTRWNSMISHGLQHGWPRRLLVSSKQAKTWTMMLCNMRNLLSDMLSHTGKCMHLACTSVFEVLRVASSCVINVWWPLSHDKIPWGLRNGQPIETTEEYVGYIDEILELDHRNHCTTMLVCDWVCPSQDPRHPNITQDQYGFTIASFNRMDCKVHSTSFAFPLHCQHVFSNDPRRP